jgi:hypothetical protein
MIWAQELVGNSYSRRCTPLEAVCPSWMAVWLWYWILRRWWLRIWILNMYFKDLWTILIVCVLMTRKCTTTPQHWNIRQVSQDSTYKHLDVAVWENIQDLATDTYAEEYTTVDMDYATNGTKQDYHCEDIKCNSGQLIVTVVVPITFVVTVYLIICVRWIMSYPGRIRTGYHLHKPGKKVPKSPPLRLLKALFTSWMALTVLHRQIDQSR